MTDIKSGKVEVTKSYNFVVKDKDLDGSYEFIIEFVDGVFSRVLLPGGLEMNDKKFGRHYWRIYAKINELIETIERDE